MFLRAILTHAKYVEHKENQTIYVSLFRGLNNITYIDHMNWYAYFSSYIQLQAIETTFSRESVLPLGVNYISKVFAWPKDLPMEALLGLNEVDVYLASNSTWLYRSLYMYNASQACLIPPLRLTWLPKYVP